MSSARHLELPMTSPQWSLSLLPHALALMRKFELLKYEEICITDQSIEKKFYFQLYSVLLCWFYSFGPRSAPSEILRFLLNKNKLTNTFVFKNCNIFKKIIIFKRLSQMSHMSQNCLIACSIINVWQGIYKELSLCESLL